MKRINLLLKKEELIFHHNCLCFIEYFGMYKFFHIIKVKKTALKIKDNIPIYITKYSIKHKQL